jgi:hypothetical protein
VLLTSSDAVLAALPPALLAEAQLLRERAMSQYQARGLFGGAHRIRHRQNSLGIGGGTETAALDRAVGVGAGTGITVGHRPLTPSSSTRIKEDEGSPLVETDALKAILRLIRLAQVWNMSFLVSVSLLYVTAEIVNGCVAESPIP